MSSQFNKMLSTRRRHHRWMLLLLMRFLFFQCFMLTCEQVKNGKHESDMTNDASFSRNEFPYFCRLNGYFFMLEGGKGEG
jgi:hypothetical protein